MKDRNHTSKLLLASATAAGIFLAGCIGDPSSSNSGGSSGDMSATFEGRVEGGTALGKRSAGSGSAGIEGATVTVMRIGAGGSLEAVSSAEAKTDAEGRFSIRSAVNGARELVVVARKDAKEWKAVVSAKAEQGIVACRPLNTESTVEADVLAEVRGETGSDEVSFADIASLIDADISARAEGHADVESFLADQVRTEAEARTAVLISSAAKIPLAKIHEADEARMDAEARLESSLDAAAELTVEARAKLDADFRAAAFKAWTDAGIALGEVAKAREASYHAMAGAEAEASVQADVKLAWLRRAALENAAALEAAVRADVEASGGEGAITVEAGTALDLSLNGADTEADIDSAFAAFRASVAAGLQAFLKTELGSGAFLSDTSRSRMDLKASLETAATAEAVAEAYNAFYVSAAAEIRAGIAGSLGTADSAKAEALTRTALLIGLQGHGGEVITVPGFSLSGKVEGDVGDADVQVARINADGSLQILSDVGTRTDAQGGFTIKTDTKLPDSVVVVVTKDSSKLMVVLDSSASEPIQVGSRTTLETKIYQQVLKDGKTGTLSTEEINSHLDSTVVAQVKGDDSAVVNLIGGLEIAAEARSSFLMDGGVGLSQSGLDAIASARAEAQAKLEADLKTAAGAAAAVQASYDTYHHAMVDAYVKAGADAEAYAQAMQVYAHALARFTVGLTAEAKFSLVRSAHAQAAHALRIAAESQAKAAGASDASLKALAEAGLALQASVEAAVSAEAIASAYAAYDASVTAALKAALVLHASAIESLNAKIRAADGARARLMADLEAAADAAAAAKAHAEFSASVEAQAKAAFGGGLGAPTEAQVDAVAEALIAANMGG